MHKFIPSLNQTYEYFVQDTETQVNSWPSHDTAQEIMPTDIQQDLMFRHDFKLFIHWKLIQ